ncbi:SDR family oxidoreductase [Halosimplex salinum]|uniref:SDR family oxidoreductase n=1 Tax=Halosimplex salinum TaxID=1710538 RepID=UPI000F4A5003|nr:SDR family oxidoreductase [Halosimplex salinum]
MTGTGSAGAAPGTDGSVLVTGATGTVGSVVAAELVQRGEPVVAASRDPVGADLPANAEPTTFDFDRPETWGRALEGIDRLFLVRPPTATRVGESVLPFLDAAERTGVDHVVVLSVLGAGNNPLLPHRRIEAHVEASSMAHTHLRASFFMQNFAEVHRDDVREGRIVVPAGDGETSFVDARDVGEVGALALVEPGHRGRAYDLTGPAALNYREVARVFSAVLDRPVTYADPSLLAFLRRELGRGRSLGFAVTMAGIYTTARLGLAGRVTDDAERVLGRPPRDLTTFVADHADLFEPA